MGYDQEAYDQSVERWERANVALADSLQRPELIEKLQQNQPDTVEELNLQAHDREFVADQADRYLDACDNYFNALSEPLSEGQREVFITNIPLEPTELAEVSYYMEHMTPEIMRYQDALKAQGFDGAQLQNVTAEIPRSLESIEEMARYYAENSEVAVKPYQDMLGQQEYKDELNDVLPTLPPTPSVVAAQSYQAERGMNDSEAVLSQDDKVSSVSSSSPYDVVEEGKMDVGAELSTAFIRADEHNGADSLETIRMTQAVEADLVAANASEYQLPGMAS